MGNSKLVVRGMTTALVVVVLGLLVGLFRLERAGKAKSSHKQTNPILSALGDYGKYGQPEKDHNSALRLAEQLMGADSKKAWIALWKLGLSDRRDGRGGSN